MTPEEKQAAIDQVQQISEGGCEFMETCDLCALEPYCLGEVFRSINFANTFLAGIDFVKGDSEETKEVCCQACSEAGGADRPIYHLPPVCTVKINPNVKIGRCPACKKPRGEDESGAYICPCPYCGDEAPF